MQAPSTVTFNEVINSSGAGRRRRCDMHQSVCLLRQLSIAPSALANIELDEMHARNSSQRLQALIRRAISCEYNRVFVGRVWNQMARKKGIASHYYNDHDADSIAGMRSIQQSVQNGQFLCRLAQNASDLLVASHADMRIERLLMHVVATALAIDQTPTSQLIEPASAACTDDSAATKRAAAPSSRSDLVKLRSVMAIARYPRRSNSPIGPQPMISLSIAGERQRRHEKRQADREAQRLFARKGEEG